MRHEVAVQKPPSMRWVHSEVTPWARQESLYLSPHPPAWVPLFIKGGQSALPDSPTVLSKDQRGLQHPDKSSSPVQIHAAFIIIPFGSLHIFLSLARTSISSYTCYKTLRLIHACLRYLSQRVVCNLIISLYN
jgi:hypothetical protein